MVLFGVGPKGIKRINLPGEHCGGLGFITDPERFNMALAKERSYYYLKGIRAFELKQYDEAI